MTWDELKQIRVREYNRPDGSPCPVCNGSGHVMEVWSNDEHFHGLLTICPECGSVRVREDDARKAGNAPRYGDYMDNEAWQRTLHRKAGEFAQRPAGVFYIGGQTATGKSHLCSKIYYHLMANGCNGLNYQPWKAFSRRSSKDWQLIETAKGCNILWLDGFLDVVNVGKGTPSAADLDRALEVIDPGAAAGKSPSFRAAGRRSALRTSPRPSQAASNRPAETASIFLPSRMAGKTAGSVRREGVIL